MQLATTARTIIRHLRDDDLADFYALCGSPVVSQYMDTGLPLTIDQTRDWITISQHNYQTRGYGCYAVIERSSGAFIGYCGLVHPPVVELIYAFRPEVWGQGYATEVGAAVIQHGFSQCMLPQITATIDPRNPASVKVAEKLGMQYVHTTLDEAGQPTLVYTLDAPLLHVVLRAGHSEKGVG